MIPGAMSCRSSSTPALLEPSWCTACKFILSEHCRVGFGFDHSDLGWFCACQCPNSSVSIDSETNVFWLHAYQLWEHLVGHVSPFLVTLAEASWLYPCFDALVSLLLTKKHILWWFESPSLWWLVGYIMLNPHHLVVKSSLSGSLKKLLSNRFPISFPLQAFASAILAIFAVSLEWWWHAQLGMSSMWDELHMEDLLDVRTGTQSSELLNAVDSAFWKRLKRKCSLNFKHF